MQALFASLLDNASETASTFLNAELFTLGDEIVTPWLLVKLAFWGAIGLVLARSFKQLLKQRLLIRLGIDASNRGAIASIASYGTLALGFAIVLQTSGINLTSLAVPAGALGVGIGLGLQNITMDFVSGISLLIERKIRVGDFVEFGDRAGHAIEISLRSTVIRTLDGANVIVPNGELVEQQVTNWHYDSLAARLHIPVGVAYGSDPLLVTETLLNAAYLEPAVRTDPPPTVIFVGFGDSALNFVLRVWIDGFEREPDLRSSLNYNIEYCLRQRNIQIPFPQRDLWLRNPEDLHPPAISDRPDDSPTVESAISLPRSLQEALRQVVYFEGFTDVELRKLIECGYRKRLHTSQILFREGEPGTTFYIILSGSVEVYVEKLDKHLRTLEAGEFFGELSLMLGIPRTASVRTLEETILFAINQKGFTKLLQDYPQVAEAIVRELAQRQGELAERQRQLRDSGLIDASEDDSNPVTWMRKRLRNLFNL